MLKNARKELVISAQFILLCYTRANCFVNCKRERQSKESKEVEE